MLPKISRIYFFVNKLGQETYMIEVQLDMDFFDFVIDKQLALEMSDRLDIDIQKN